MRHGETCRGEHTILLAGKDFCCSESRPGLGRRRSGHGGPHPAGKHLFRVDGDERPDTPRQDFALAVADLRYVRVFAPLYALLPPGGSQELAQRHRFHIPDLHRAGKGQDVAKLVYLAHGLVKDGGDNSAVRVPRRPRVPARQFEMANGFPRIFIQRELQTHAMGIVMPAAEAVVLAWCGLSDNRMPV